MVRTENFNPQNFKPARFESDGEITVKGVKIPYHTVCEDNVFYSNDGKPIASIFSYSYFRSDVKDPSSRPVLFGYNGGPGSASFYVHAGFLGAKRVRYPENVDRETSLPPFEVIDNPDSLLDECDIVVVDPVNVGYGVLLDEESGKKFFGLEEDGEALLEFIEMWLHRYNRWLSPKYLVGESYGCTRNAYAVGIANGRGSERAFGVRFDGVVNIGNTVSVGKYFFREVPVEESVVNFPTFAAVNWYHNHPSKQSLEEFVAEAKEFADSDYVLALYKGEKLQGKERDRIIKKISYYAGVDRDYLERNDLKINDATFRINVIKDKGLSAARYDGRITRPVYEPRAVEESITGLWDDASGDRYDAFFYSALTGVILPSLNVKLDRQYVKSFMMGDKWNREATRGTTAEMLRNAMKRTFGMRTFFANGYYDGATAIGIVYHTCDHAHLPMDRVIVKGYPSGHMIYIGEENCRDLCEDIRNFVMHREVK
ncbi:MAG: hypothetical protein IJM15_06665 [Erysipelotrichaceae bacterium]|nr:hypothetical protein [Erysipelotrichaceae bacterium]